MLIIGKLYHYIIIIHSRISNNNLYLSIDPLISELRSGDQNAFKKLVEIYRQKVFNTAINLLQDHELAEDVSQEVFVTIFRSVATFNAKSSLSTWIYRITVNKCLDQLRARQRQKFGLFSQFFDNTFVIENKPGFDHPGIILENRETARYLFKAIESLPHNQKTVFVLSHIEELPQKEIAEIMDMSVKAIESLVQRAKANLRKKLSDIYDRRKTN